MFKRRDFVKSCVGLMALSVRAAARAQQLGDVARHQRTQLMDSLGAALRAADLQPGTSYVFHYPFVATPCFLVDLGQPAHAGAPLGTEDGERYEWQGGVGADDSIVAFSAICAHKMTHPTRSVSFINYRHKKITYTDSREREATGSHLIYCCSEHSVYDARDGARVLGGPAKQPLAAILLEHDPADDTLYATGTYGGELFTRYFKIFRFRLQLEHGVTAVDKPVGGRSTVTPLEDYTKRSVLCV